MVHTYYREPGGEDIVFDSEASLLESRGHEVHREEFSNRSIPESPTLRESFGLAIGAVWSREVHDRFTQVIREFKPDVAHFHNTFLQVPLSVYAHCRRQGVAVVQTLHNYRLLCPSATFYRDGQVCMDCLGRRFAYPGIVHACYRNSRGMSATLALMHGAHRLKGTWWNDIDRFIALSLASRDIFVEGGLPAESIVVKPNFLVSDPPVGDHSGGFAIFVGRLAQGKGVKTLIDSWKGVDPGFKLKIVGVGPLSEYVEDMARRHEWIEWLGWRSQEDVLELVGNASVLVFPSEWNETFGRTIAEAFARGTPVLASNLGAARHLVTDGETGMRFEAGNVRELTEKANWMYRNPDQLRKMGEGARALYEREFTPERNYHQLIDIYEQAIEHHRATKRRGLIPVR